ncbi:glycosyltransferase [Cochlodiniinecator piscidefendens]|uniref:glycosyltransferase n=1 Tax=Cochlodiniinecator piscidefendens TaxID=2715756 RepID=UPI00140E6368
MEYFNQVIGLIRFSYPARTGFRIEHETDEDRETFLFDRERLERRFHLLETLTIPSLIAQEDQEFSLVVLTGDNLPDWAKERLEKSITGLHDARIVYEWPRLHQIAIRRAFDAIKIPWATHFTTFRLDDDDAVAKSFTRRTKATASMLIEHERCEAPVVIGYNKGFYLNIMDGDNDIYDVSEKTPLGIGLSLLAPADYEQNIYVRNHRMLPAYFDTYTVADTPMFIRSVHGDNDSTSFMSGKERTMSRGEINLLLMTEFGFGLEHVMDI